MYRSGSTDTQSHLPGWFFRLLLVIGFACLFVISTTVAASTTYASGRPGGNVTDPVVRAVDIAEPAVVRIITSLGGHLTVHFSQGNVTFPQGTGNSYPLQLSGSGTFITAHGDILTADHVINPPHDQALSQFLDDQAAKDVAAYINLNAKSGSQVSVDQIDQELKSGSLQSAPTYDPATSEVFLNTTYTESSFNQKDVAVVHVKMNDMASVQLGDSGSVQQQDQLTIIGFPGNGDVSDLPTDLLTASVNTISVSSTKTTNTGAQVIQVGGNVEHGDSGGPALDSNGAVVGIVSFGLVNSGSPGGTSFLQASSSARDLVQSLNLNTAPGAFQQTWSKAMTDYASNAPGHWHKAQQEFEQIAAKYPLFKGVTSYLTYTQQQAKTEKLPSTTSPATRPAPTNTLAAYAAWIIGGVIVLILLLALLSMVFFFRRRKTNAANRANPGRASQDQGVRPATIEQRGPNSHPGEVAGQQKQGAPQDDGMAAFGAPSATHTPQPVQSSSTSVQTVVSGTLRPWPCGHMNRANARFCSICGEPAPTPPTSRRLEQ